ncbi:MAG: polysaccharide biosynthesis/export family protein [Candidatus Omnitrophota bacterium]
MKRAFKLMRVRAVIFAFLIAAVSLPLPLHAEDYRLGPDDVLEITVYREDELYRVTRISSNGNLSFPLLGEVKAEGLTPYEFQSALEEKLRRYLKKPQVTVFIKEYSTISVTGQVNEPGSFPLKGGLTVLEAIGLAKGFTKMAGQNNVKILRMEDGEKKTLTVKVGDISKKGDKSKDVQLQRGDIVYVPESLF